jgi:hypothetical protein
MNKTTGAWGNNTFGYLLLRHAHAFKNPASCIFGVREIQISCSLINFRTCLAHFITHALTLYSWQLRTVYHQGLKTVLLLQKLQKCWAFINKLMKIAPKSHKIMTSTNYLRKSLAKQCITCHAMQPKLIRTIVMLQIATPRLVRPKTPKERAVLR